MVGGSILARRPWSVGAIGAGAPVAVGASPVLSPSSLATTAAFPVCLFRIIFQTGVTLYPSDPKVFKTRPQPS